MMAQRPDAANWTPIRTKPISPSKIAIALACPLRYLFETERAAHASLIESISSLLGRSIHHVLNLIASGTIGRERLVVRDALSAHLVQLIAQQPTAQAILATLGQSIPTVDAIVPAAQFAEKIRMLFRAIDNLSDDWPDHQRRRTFKTAPTSGAQGQKSKNLEFGSEIQMGSNSLDLRGRADMVERLAPNTIRVTEFKSGGTLDDENQPRTSHLLQVCAYALVQAERYNDHSIIVRLIAADGEWERPFTNDLAEMAHAALAELRDQIPRNVALDPIQSAKPGLACVSCRFRPDCGQYRKWANASRNSGVTGMPLDVWGRIESIEAKSSLWNVRLKTSEGMRVRISTIPSVLLTSCSAGEYLEAFELRSSESGRGNVFPLNLQIVDARHPHLSAYGAVIRRDGGDPG